LLVGYAGGALVRDLAAGVERKVVGEKGVGLKGIPGTGTCEEIEKHFR
jgi:hypothetical protein